MSDTPWGEGGGAGENLQIQRETGQKFGGIFKMGNILEVNALKNDIGLMAKTYFFVIPDTRNTR